MILKRRVFTVVGSLLFLVGILVGVDQHVETEVSAAETSIRTSSPKVTQYFDIKIFNQSQKTVKKMKQLRKNGVEMALVPLPYTAFIKAPAGSRVVVKQGRTVYYNKVVKRGVGFLKISSKKPFNISRPILAYAKLSHHATSKVVHYHFKNYPGY